MAEPLRRAALFALGLAVACSAQALEVGGYYKNLAIASETFLGAQENYWLDINRLRLELSQDWERVALDLQYDNELQTGNYLDTLQFRRFAEADDPRYWQWQGNSVDRGDVYGSHELYRATLSVEMPGADLRLGRQQINWATALIWNPMDSFNPLNPLQLERDERRGVDAVLVDADIGTLSRLSVAYAPQHRHSQRQSAVRFKTHSGAFDWSLMAGDFAGERKIGADFAGQLGLVGLRSEWVYNQPEEGGNYTEWVLSADYSLPSGFTFLVEAFFNGDGHSDAARYDLRPVIAGEKLAAARHYLGGRVSRALSARLDVDLSVIRNLDDNSHYLYPSASLAVPGFEDLYLSAGAQLFYGGGRDEYAYFNHIYYLEVKAFF